MITPDSVPPSFENGEHYDGKGDYLVYQIACVASLGVVYLIRVIVSEGVGRALYLYGRGGWK